MSFLNKLMLGVLAFKEAYISAPIQDTEDWTSQGARRVRYDMLWGQYEQTSYRDVHSWATAYRKQYSLYKYIRPIYNPAYRLGEFWKAHLFGGQLDPEAGEEGAIPILTENLALREAISNLWKWSRWGVQKDVLTVRGTVLGDIAIRVVDDVSRGRVYLDILHPGVLDTVDKDPFGNVKGYTIKETKNHPEGKGGTVTYGEEVTRNGDFVVYKTTLNGSPYAWPGNTDVLGRAVAAWSEPYSFVPLVVLQHNDVGLEWGWSELHAIRAKVQEADDIASMISDSVRKTIDPTVLATGIKRPSSGVITLSGANAATHTTGASDRPFPGREEMQVLYLGKDGKAEIMAPNLEIANVLSHLEGILAEIERDVIELSQDIHTSSGDASGRALRVARQPVVAKVIQRRANYDTGMVSAQQMAIAIGGWRGYEGYEGFDLNSYKSGALDHTIAPRPVFDEDPLDKAEVSSAFWEAAKKAVEAGISLEAYLEDAGWDESRIRGAIDVESSD